MPVLGKIKDDQSVFSTVNRELFPTWSFEINHWNTNSSKQYKRKEIFEFELQGKDAHARNLVYCCRPSHIFRKRRTINIKIDLFKVNDAILQGVQNCWGERKIYSQCMEKVGSLMLDNLRIDILPFLWIRK